MPAAKSSSPCSEQVAALVAAVDRAPDEASIRATFRHRFGRLRREWPLHPAGATPARTFEEAALPAREIAAECLPLGVGIVMHLYPLCALRCVPLPWFAPESARRTRLLRAIDRDALILANAGSERSSDVRAPVTVTRDRRGLRVDGSFDYVSLANVADLVLFSAPLAGSDQTAFCIADLRDEGVCIGASRFDGSMRLSDTCAVSFSNHVVPTERSIVVPGEAALNCMAQYQRAWFQLLLSESYLARVERLQQQWSLPLPADHLASRNELSCLRSYALHLLDDARTPSQIAELAGVSAAIKLRVSLLCQATAGAVLAHDAAAANELGFLRLQPTADDKILQELRRQQPERTPLLAQLRLFATAHTPCSC
jgi:alkylation response protein AidB-like acyl-CoA dehydrogenase